MPFVGLVFFLSFTLSGALAAQDLTKAQEPKPKMTARGKELKAQKKLMSEVSGRLQKSLVLVFDEHCNSCAHLVEKMGKECAPEKLKRQLGVLGFGQRLKLKSKLQAIKDVKTEVHPLNQSRPFFIEITPALWVEDEKEWRLGIQAITEYLWDKDYDLCHS